jgi:hypothetical protein
LLFYGCFVAGSLLFGCSASRETASGQQENSKEYAKKYRKFRLWRPDNSTGRLLAAWTVEVHLDQIQAITKRDTSGIQAGCRRDINGREAEISEIRRSKKTMIINLRHKPVSSCNIINAKSPEKISGLVRNQDKILFFKLLFV